ncbi:UNVERIFIED_CONTAM: hypothetical protein RMT77_006009 [Armadillidium vulgare]
MSCHCNLTFNNMNTICSYTKPPIPPKPLHLKAKATDIKSEQITSVLFEIYNHKERKISAPPKIKVISKYKANQNYVCSNCVKVKLVDEFKHANHIIPKTTMQIKNVIDIVPNNSGSTENGYNQKAYYVAKELKTSEESFIRVLKVLNFDFKEFLIRKECLSDSRENTLPKHLLDEIFEYLPNLQKVNEELLKEFEMRVNNWSVHPKIADVIITKGPFLKLYIDYIKNLQTRTNLLQKCAKEYSYFGECLLEFEKSELGACIPISKHMLTPMQRITKYEQLMIQYIKYLNESHIDYCDAVTALNIVKEVIGNANEAVREMENSARLLCLQERLNGITTAEGTTSVSSSSGSLQHLLVEPGKKLLKEGQLMKLCRRGVRIVYLILLSDSLLYTIEELHGGKNCPLKLRYKLPLEGMRVDIPVSEDFQNEFTVISTSRSFTIRASSSKERDEWITCLREAIESNATRRYSFEKAKTADFEYLSLNVLGKQAPAWIPDNRVTMCQVCTSEFSLTFRRHHCRACGKVVCRYCSANRAPLEYLDNNCERVCDYCYDELLKAHEEKEEKEEDIDDDEEKEKYKKKLKSIKAKFKKSLRDVRKCRLKKPERLLEVCGGDHESQICGYLRHYSRRTWRQSWFVLKHKVMYEYRAPEDVCALSSLPVLGYSVSSEFKSLEIFDGMDPANAFKLEHINQSPHIFYADTNELATKWKTSMEKEVVL